MTTPFRDALRGELVTGARRYRRRRRARVLAGGAAVVVLAVALTATLAGRTGDDDGSVRAGPGPASTAAPSSTSTSTTTAATAPDGPGLVANPLPGGPTIALAEEVAATEEVAAFLRALRAGDDAAAAARWSGYPDALGASPEETAATKLAAIRALREDQPWLVADGSPAFDVTAAAAPSTAAPVPVVTVTVSTPEGRRAAAFVLGGRGAAGDLLIERLPTLAELPTITPDPTSGTRLVSVPRYPLEGGARAFVDGVEVPSSLDTDRLAVVFEVPASTSASVVVTVTVATPEVADAVAYVIDPGA